MRPEHSAGPLYCAIWRFHYLEGGDGGASQSASSSGHVCPILSFFPELGRTQKEHLAQVVCMWCEFVHVCACSVAVSGTASETVRYFRVTVFWQLGGSGMDQFPLKGKTNIWLCEALCAARAKADVFTWFSETFK